MLLIRPSLRRCWTKISWLRRQSCVAAADPQYRGYDIEIVTRLAGLDESEQVMFVRAAAPIATIDPGGEVFVFGTRGPQPAEISSSGGCTVLTPIP